MIKRSLLRKELEDDPTSEGGGISFLGETLLDFLQEVGMHPYSKALTLNEVNDALSECGIKKIHE